MESPALPARFYRATGREPVEAVLLNGWTYEAPVGSRHLIQYVEEHGWTGWSVLANLTLPSSPYRFIDLTSPIPYPGRRFYRTTHVP